jgi:hypothetical protein
MTPAEKLEPKGRMTLGLVFIALGLILTLDQAGILDIRGIGRWWPLLLIGVGVVKVRQPLQDGQRAAGVGFLFLGGFFLLVNVLSWGRAWPLGVVLVGVLLLWQAFDRSPATGPKESESPVISELAVMGGLKRGIRALGLQGGYITAVMGGVELDLRRSKIGASPAHVDVFALWGGIELKVPSEWSVEGRVVPFMGGFENTAQPVSDSIDPPRLVVRGHAVMGYIEITN